MGKLSKKLVSIVTTVVVASSLFATNSFDTKANAATLDTVSQSVTSVESTSIATDASSTAINEGVILHAWNWSFNSIKENIKSIADAGYTSVQTSPAQACLEGSTGTDKSLVNTLAHPTWYYAYQPTYFTLGNYELGTAAEFKAMCDEAHKYGVKIVVDVVANHLADVLGDANKEKLVDQELLAGRHTDPKIVGTDWNVRNRVTQGSVIGMPDINTQTKAAQKKVSDYLVQCVDAGADGFRFDAAKSIELPTDAAGNKTSDFWPTIMGAATAEGKTKNKEIFYYGEVLQGDSIGTNFSGYAKIMGVTATTYGWFLRSAVGSEVWEDGSGVLGGNGVKGVVEPKISASLVSSKLAFDDDLTIKNNQLVGLIETHDTYANAGASRYLTQNQIQLAWAMLAARDEIVPLYFNRPTSQAFTGSALNPQGEPYNTMGQKGSDDYKSTNVVAINKFHNAMVGQAETVSAELNSKVMKIARGDKGLVLVNVGGNADFTLKTTLKDGTYTNQAEGGGTFTVKDGSISGKISASSMIVLYDKGATPATTTTPTTATPATVTPATVTPTTSTPASVSKTAVYYSKPTTWGDKVYAYVYKDGGKPENAKWPGVEMTKNSDGIYSYEVPDNLKDGAIIFSDNGSNQYPSQKQPGIAMELGKLYKDGVWSTIVIKTPLTLSVISDKESPQQKGSTIKLTAKGNGGTGALSYSFKVTGFSVPNVTPTETLINDNGVATWKPTEGGNYNITVIVTDADGVKVSYTLSYSVCEIPATTTPSTVTPATTTASTVTPATTTASTVTPATKTASTPTPATETPVKKELKITASAGTLALKADEKTIITATATDGQGTVNYKFNVKIGNTTFIGQDYSTENKFEFKSSDAGKYEITVIAKDSNGKEVTITNPIVINVTDTIQEDTTPKVPDIPEIPTASKTPIVDNDTTTVVIQKATGTVSTGTISTGTVSTATVTNKDKEDKSTQNAPTMDSNSMFGVLAMMSLAGATLVLGKKKEKN